MTRLRVRLLGTFQVDLEGGPITQFESNKVRALLAYLVVEGRQAHSREKLAALFWPEMPARRASSNLSQALYNLRRLIQDQQAQPPHLLRGRESIQINPESDFWLDVEAFNRALDGHSPSDPPHPKFSNLGLKGLQAALDLYQGDFLDGFTCDSSNAFDEWLIILRQRLQRQAIEGYHHLAEALADHGDLEAALPYAWREVALDPLNESACRQLMRLLTANGQRNQALAQFDRLQVVLTEELSVTPEPATLKLRDQIRADGDRVSPAAVRRDNLPAFLTPMIGRRRELAEVCQRLESPDCRLLTILGPGGSGKTRLALEVARSCRPSFPQGVFFVALNPVQSTDSIVPTVGEALGAARTETGDYQSLLANYLRNKEILLVLDGCEHLLAGAVMLAELMRWAPGLKVLATSRARLCIKGEHWYTLSGMGYPSEAVSPQTILESDAVQLLVSSLQRSQPAYQPRPEDVLHLLQICRQVQGMPLGLLLAASWGSTFSLEEIATRVSGSLDLLVADWADMPPRQRSLRSTLDHTWVLLSECQQHTFQSLSVFRGAFTRAAARAVSGASHHELRRLVDHSLLENKTPGWYQVHELLRQYGREKLTQNSKQETEVCDRHSRYYLAQLTQLGQGVKRADYESTLQSIDLEHENYWASWRWAVDRWLVADLAPALETFCLYYDLRHRYAEGINLCGLALASLPKNQPDLNSMLFQAGLYIWQSRFSRFSGDLVQAADAFASARQVLSGASAFTGNPHTHLDDGKSQNDQTSEQLIDKVQAIFNFQLGELTYARDRSEAIGYYQESLALYQKLGLIWWVIRVILQITLSALQLGDFDAAEHWLDLFFQVYSTGCDRHQLAFALERKAYIHNRRGELDRAMQAAQEAVDIYRSIGDVHNLAKGSSLFGTSLAWHGRFPQALEWLAQSHATANDIGDFHRSGYTGLVIGLVYTLMGRYPEAEIWVNKSLSLGEKLEFRRITAGAWMTRGWIALGRGDLMAALQALQESVAGYRLVNHRDELGWALATLGHTQLQLGEIQAGLANIQECLSTGLEMGAVLSIGHALGPSALWISRQGDPLRGLERYTLARQHPSFGNSYWFEAVYGKPIMDLIAILPEEAVGAAQERGRVIDLWETTEELLGELGLE